jgi:hypothetical protein
MRIHYSVVDLLRFHRFANEHSGLKPIELLKLYEETYPELSEQQKLENLKKFLNKHCNYDNRTL